MTPLVPPEGQQVFSQAFAAQPTDIDANGHVNNVVYVRWIQDIATAHWRARMEGRVDADGWAWVVLRHEIDYRRALLPGETATGRTWVGAHKGPRFIRYVRIDGPDGEVCAQATTEWCLIDAASGRPSRVQAWMVERFL